MQSYKDKEQYERPTLEYKKEEEEEKGITMHPLMDLGASTIWKSS
jgi:hypothetical protein